MSTQETNPFVYLPFTKEAHFAFAENLAKTLKKDTNGQFNRKPSWLGARIAASLPNRPENFNVNTLLDLMRELKGADETQQAVPESQSNTVVNVKSSLEGLLNFFNDIGAGTHEKLVLQEIQEVALYSDHKKVHNLVHEFLNNDFETDSTVYIYEWLTNCVGQLLTNTLECDEATIIELWQCVNNLDTVVKSFQLSMGLHTVSSFEQLIGKNKACAHDLIQIAKNIAEASSVYSYAVNEQEPDGYHHTAYWDISESMSFKDSDEMFVFIADNCIKSQAYGEPQNEYGNLRSSLEILHVFRMAHKVAASDYEYFNGHSCVSEAVNLLAKNTLRKSCENPTIVVDTVKKLETNYGSTGLAKYIQDYVHNIILKNCCEGIASSIIECVCDENVELTIADQVTGEPTTVFNEVEKLCREMKRELSYRENITLKQELLKWAANPVLSELVNETHANHLTDFERSLPFTEQQFVVASGVMTGVVAEKLLSLLTEIAATCHHGESDNKAINKLIEKALSGGYILTNLQQLTTFEF